MGIVETHLDLFQREIKEFLDLGYFVQDWRLRWERSDDKDERKYYGSKQDVANDPLLSTNSFRRLARKVAAEHKRPFIWVRLCLDHRHAYPSEPALRALIVIPKRKSTQALLSCYRLLDPPKRRYGDAPLSAQDGYGIVTLWMNDQHYARFQQLMDMPEIRAAMKLPNRLRIAA